MSFLRISLNSCFRNGVKFTIANKNVGNSTFTTTRLNNAIFIIIAVIISNIHEINYFDNKYTKITLNFFS